MPNTLKHRVHRALQKALDCARFGETSPGAYVEILDGIARLAIDLADRIPVKDPRVLALVFALKLFLREAEA